MERSRTVEKQVRNGIELTSKYQVVDEVAVAPSEVTAVWREAEQLKNRL